MKFLGLRLCEHDSNISYSDGVSVKYYKPERYNQVKHYGYNNLFEWTEVENILGIKINELDAIAIVIDVFRYPHLKKEDPQALFEKFNIPDKPFSDLSCPVFRVDHHYAHSLSSWMLTDTGQPRKDFVLDGFGDLQRSCSIFSDNKFVDVFTLSTMYSLGKQLALMGEHMGIHAVGDDAAGKLMALKAFGNFNQKYYDHISQYGLEDTKKIFDFSSFIKVVGSELAANYKFIDYLRTMHDYMEVAFPKFFTKYANKEDVVTYSGGVAHNVCINTQIKKELPKLIIPPHCNDEGLSLGCIEFLRQHYNQPEFDNNGFPYWQTDMSPSDEPLDETIKKTAEDLANGKIIGWYQGHGEVGPRALGNRSILMSPEVKEGKHILNSKVKHREDYRPFAASILYEDTKDYFDWEGDSDFMKYSVKFKDKIFQPISHIDNTSRIQTVKPELKLYYSLISEFKKLTGLPMLLNTSLNDNGKPIAGKPGDAIALLKNSELDQLVVGNTTLKK
jgi:carbamoyltransferase